jgi:uncharacterized protein YdaL
MSLKKLAGMCLALGIALAGSTYAAVVPTKRVLILYDSGADKREPALTDAKYLANLMGHFNTSVRLAPVAAYQAGEMDRADNVFYINYEKKYMPPDAFKADFYR